MKNKKNAGGLPVSQGQQIQNLNSDIAKHHETERLLRANVAYKDVLLEEISHRVLNSFHLVAGMLQLQARIATDAQVKMQLEVAAQRVFSMASLHRRLYETAKDITSVNAKVYLTGLCDELRQGFFAEGSNLTLLLDSVQDLDLPTETMAFMGLAISELVTNACKYAYKAGEPGEVSISLSRFDGAYRLSVSDTGAGLPPGFDIGAAKGLGMNIIKAQIKELNGTLEINRTSPGVSFVITIPA